MTDLTLIDTVPVFQEEFSFEFESWLTILVDSVNYNLNTLQSSLYTNGLQVPQFTQAQIVAMAPSAPDGTLWYSTTSSPPMLVIKIAGATYKPTVSSWP